MTIEELEVVAANGESLPVGLDLPEQWFFLNLREIYRQFQNRVITKELGRKEKQFVRSAYEKMAAEYKVLIFHRDIRRRLEREIGNLHKGGCEQCRKFIRIFDGIDRTDIPEDVRELHEWNEKLRDLVQQRSERAAELRSYIDRIALATQSDSPAEAQIEKIKAIIEEATR